MIQTIRDKWYEFTNKKFIEFRGDTRKSITDFADWLGFPVAQMSQFMNKPVKIPTSQKALNKWVKRYGKEIYDVLDMPIPDDSLLLLPEPAQSIAREIKETLAEYEISPDTPEAGEVVDEIMKKHGYSLTSTSDDPSE